MKGDLLEDFQIFSRGAGLSSCPRLTALIGELILVNISERSQEAAHARIAKNAVYRGKALLANMSVTLRMDEVLQAISCEEFRKKFVEYFTTACNIHETERLWNHNAHPLWLALKKQPKEEHSKVKFDWAMDCIF